MTGRGKHPDDDDALWQKVTSDVRAYDRAAELTSPAGPAVAKPCLLYTSDAADE